MMPCLHIVNHAPLNNTTSWQNSLRYARTQDVLLLIEDGTYALLQTDLIQQLENRTLYALQADIEARGLGRYAHLCQTVDYSGFVQLTETHSSIICWH